MPPYHSFKERIHNIGGRFSPVHFQRLGLRWVRYYALFKGWLLLSQPSHCLKTRTTFDTLNQHLGTLIAVWVLSLSDTKITPAPSLQLTRRWIRSLTRQVAVSHLGCLIRALPHRLLRARLHLDAFREEPAIVSS